MQIIHVDEHILVINKPAGLPVLADGWDKDAPYLVKIIEEEYGKIWVVHRLDKTTSGVMVFARTAESHRALNTQFENREADKVYHAIMEGNPKWDEKVVKFPLRANVGKKHRTAVDNKNGKPSETRFRILKRYQSSALVEAKPMTGRTHQIRVHAYGLGHPLLGDALYKSGDNTSEVEVIQTEVISRPALHAHSLTFTHPANNERLTFKAERPQDFVRALERLGV